MLFKILSRIDPYNRELSIRNRKKVRITNQWFDDVFGNLFWPNKAKEIGIHGGLGDALLLLPYLKKYKNTYTKRKLKIIYTNVSTDKQDPNQFGLGLTRFEKSKSDKLVNPIADLLENVNFIDEKVGGDPTNAKEYWHPDIEFQNKWGSSLPPKEYVREIFDDIFNEEDQIQANQFYNDNDLDSKFVIAFHLRRGSDKILKIAQNLLTDPTINSNIKCLFLGSSRNENLPEFKNLNQIDLTDNYEKNISLRTLYKIVMKSQLFIGGRGSFEHIFWLAQVPSINLMDKQGYEGNNAQFGTWMPEFWEENKFKEQIFYETADLNHIINNMIKPYINLWNKENNT